MKKFFFRDRVDAGKQLAEKLLSYRSDRALVLAIPRGGVPVGYEVALRLDAVLDTIVVRKIGAPFNPEFGVGAVAPGDILVLDNAMIQSLGVTEQELDPIIAKEITEMERRVVRYRSGEYSKDVEVDTVILVDDGLATGVSARAAIQSIHLLRNPKKIVFAAPVCAEDTVEFLKRVVDVVVCVTEVCDLGAIGYWYENFPQTTDEEVVHALKNADRRLLR